jgi:hypothetical protein
MPAIPHPDQYSAPLLAIRFGQYLALASVFAGLAVAGVIAAFAPAILVEPTPYTPKERAAAEIRHNKAVWEWSHQNRDSRDRPPEPVEPRPLVATGPDRREAIAAALAGRKMLLLLPLAPALLLAASGLFAVVGRVRLARAAVGTGASTVFVAATLLMVGVALGGLLAVYLSGRLAVGFDGLAADGRSFPNVAGGAVAALVFAWVCGLIGDAVSVSGLALVSADPQHRRRIGSAVAFYPVLLVCLFWVAVSIGALAATGAKLPTAFLAGVGLTTAAGVHAIQTVLLNRAYRFPPAADAVN